MLNSPPLINPDLEKPETLGWFYKMSGFLGVAVKITSEPLPYDEVARLE